MKIEFINCAIILFNDKPAFFNLFLGVLIVPSVYLLAPKTDQHVVVYVQECEQSNNAKADWKYYGV